MRRIQIALLVAAVIACGHKAEPPPPPRDKADPRESTFARGCPDLPERRPGDLVVRLSVHDYEAPELLQRWAIASAAGPCPTDPMPAHLWKHYAAQRCLLLPDDKYDALFAELRRLGIDRIRIREMPPHAHRGGSAVELSWGDKTCRVADIINDTEPAPDDRDSYHAVDNAIRGAIHGSARP
jgi:hypothetical protein